jgi:hypothetical protein
VDYAGVATFNGAPGDPDSAGETIEFMLSPKRDLIAAKLFLRLALFGGGLHRE